MESIAALFLLLITAVAASLSGPPAQKPLGAHDHGDGGSSPGGQQMTRWTLNFSSPLPHLFASVPTLLHQWGNTLFPNGHGLAAVEIPAYTLLHHGLLSPVDADPEPPSPEWLAFDLEMSYGIMGSARDSFLLTYQTTRPVRALYFDGESAALMGLGQLDTQMLLLFGNVSGPGPGGRGGFGGGLGDEYLRAHGLCDWLEAAGLRGRGWGFEGVVRMNAGFELIWCDFVSPSLRLVSRMNVTAPLLPEQEEEKEEKHFGGGEHGALGTDYYAALDVVNGMNDLAGRGGETTSRGPVSSAAAAAARPTSYYPLPPEPTKTDRNSEPSHGAPPPNMRRDVGREPFLRAQGWGWFDSATWHYGANRNGPGRGETRARVLGCGILSYYSPRFAGQTRRRALDEQPRLNLTSEGLWAGPGRGGDGDGDEAVAVAARQLARRRRFHHLGNVSTDEAALMRRSSERALRSLLEPAGASCSGADWTAITSEITQRVTNHLTMLDTKLAAVPGDAEESKAAAYKWLFGLRAESHQFMVPYLEYPQEIDRDTWSTDTRLYRESHARCQYRYTRLLVPEELPSPLSPEEQDLRLAVEEVYGTICSVLMTMGFGIELAWLDMLARDGSGASSRGPALSSQAATWRDNIAELTAWLGWEGQYYGCAETCAWDERCYIPMWPLMHWGGMGRGPGRGGPGRGGPGNGTHGGGPGRDRDAGGGRGHALDADDLPRPPPPPGDDGPGPGHGRPGFKMPPRGPAWMGDDTDLWEPKCVNITFIMGER